MELQQRNRILFGCCVFIMVLVIIIVMALMGVFDSKSPSPTGTDGGDGGDGGGDGGDGGDDGGVFDSKIDPDGLTYTIKLNDISFNLPLLVTDFRKTEDGTFFKWDWCTVAIGLNKNAPRYVDLKTSIEENIDPLPKKNDEVDYGRIVWKGNFLSNSELSVIGTDNCDGSGTIYDVQIPTVNTFPYASIILTKKQFTDLGYNVDNVLEDHLFIHTNPV